MSKIKNIEFVRILFTMIIVYGHLMQWYILPNFSDVPAIKTIYKYFSLNFGYIVEIFFILSGFFLAKSAMSDQAKSWTNFLKTKIIRLWPVLAFSFVAIGVLAAFKLLHFEKYPNFFALFFLDAVGLTSKISNNGYAWYISSMFWVLLFYYYLLRNFQSKYINIIIALIVYSAYSMLLPGDAFYGENRFLLGFFSVDVLRALSGVGMGYFIALFYYSKQPSQNDIKISRSSYIGISILEVYLLGYLTNNFIIHSVGTGNKLIFIIPFSVLFYLFLIKKGWLSNFLDKDLWVNIGKYSYSIYVMQIIVFTALTPFFFSAESTAVKEYPILVILITLALCISLGIVTYHCIEKPGAKLLKKLLFKPTEENA